MRIVRTSEQAALQDVLRNMLASAATPERVSAVADGPELLDTQLWAAIVSELGIAGLLVPTEHGGAGGGWPEVMAVLGELGKRLAPVPFLTSSVLSVSVLAHGEPAEHDIDLLGRLAAGEDRAAVSVPHAADPLAQQSEFHAVDDGGWRLSGRDDHVVDGASTDVLLVLAEDDAGRRRWFTVDVNSDGVTVDALESLDPTRPVARVDLAGVRARVVGSDDDLAGRTSALIDAASAGLAAEQAAASSHLLQLSVDHARERVQFGQPIGSFQAIQHRLADLAVIVDESESAVELALWALVDSPAELAAATSAASAICGDGAVTVAQEAIQVHGGIGFTWEHVCHRYLRRARSSRSAFGTPAQHRERLLNAAAV